MADDLGKCGVYTIRCKQTGRVYVGSAAKSFRNRWKLHRSDLRNNKHHSPQLQNAWNKYGPDNFEFKVAEYCLSEHAVAQEQVYIDYYLQRGKDFLMNVCYVAGSCKGTKQSDAVNKKRSDQMKKHFEDPEYRAAHKVRSAAAVKKIFEDPSHVEKMSNVMKERHAQPGFTQKMVDASLKVRETPEHKAKMKAVLEEMHNSPKYIAKMKVVRERDWNDPEFCKNHSDKLRERHADPEYKQKHKAALQERWSKRPEDVEKQRERLAAQKADPVFKEKQREAMRKLWQDPVFLAKHAARVEARRKKKHDRPS